MSVLTLLLNIDDISFNTIYIEAFNNRNDLRDNPLDSEGGQRFSFKEKALITASFEVSYQAKQARQARKISPDFFEALDQLSKDI